MESLILASYVLKSNQRKTEDSFGLRRSGASERPLGALLDRRLDGRHGRVRLRAEPARVSRLRLYSAAAAMPVSGFDGLHRYSMVSKRVARAS